MLKYTVFIGIAYKNRFSWKPIKYNSSFCARQMSNYFIKQKYFNINYAGSSSKLQARQSATFLSCIKPVRIHGP
jgi:hypothetical protein